jgi:hypothetical protein
MTDPYTNYMTKGGGMLGRTSKLEGTNEPKREIAGKERPKGLLLLSLGIYTAE